MKSSDLGEEIPDVVEQQVAHEFTEDDSIGGSWPWEVVDDSFRTAPKYLFEENDLTNALLDGKTIKVPKEFPTDKVYRWGRAKKKYLKTRTFKDFVAIWFEDEPGKRGMKNAVTNRDDDRKESGTDSTGATG